MNASIKCRYCGSEMERKFSFSEDKNLQRLCCPGCGAETAGKPVEYDDEGRLLRGRRKNNNPQKKTDTSTERSNRHEA